MKDRLKINIEGHVADVMLNRPDKYNALDLRMFEALNEAAEGLAKEPSVRAVVLHGEGDHFCAGIDVSVLSDPNVSIDASMLAPMASSPANLFQRAAYGWRELEVPVICALRGTTFGGGLQVALGADLRYSATDARFSVMEAKWGIIPDMAITATARDIIRPDHLKELAWSARIFDAEEALQLGVITAIHDDPLAAAYTAAEACAERSPQAIRGVKRLVNEAWHLSEPEALALEARLQLDLLGTPNQAEAVLANLQKRSPEFSD